MPSQHEEGDGSASTAQFRAFTDRYGDPDGVPPWNMRAPRDKVIKLVVAVIAVALVLGLIAFLVI